MVTHFVKLKHENKPGPCDLKKNKYLHMKAKLSTVAIALLILAFILGSCSISSCPTYSRSKKKKGEKTYAKATNPYGSRIRYRR
jgi:hypothetical protein